MEESTFIISLILSFIVPALIISFVRGKDQWGYQFGDWYFKQLFGYLIYAVILIFVSYNVVAEIDMPDPRYEKEHYLYIYSLKNQNDTSGDFFLGSGAIESTEYYYYFYKGQNGYRRSKERVYDVSIQETDSRRPEIVKIIKTYSHEKSFIKWTPQTHSENYIMYVPTNTIIRNFKVY